MHKKRKLANRKRNNKMKKEKNCERGMKNLQMKKEKNGKLKHWRQWKKDNKNCAPHRGKQLLSSCGNFLKQKRPIREKKFP